MGSIYFTSDKVVDFPKSSHIYNTAAESPSLFLQRNTLIEQSTLGSIIKHWFRYCLMHTVDHTAWQFLLFIHS